VERPDVLDGGLDRPADLPVEAVVGALGVGGHLQVADLDAVELPGERPERGVALRPDPLDDLPGVPPDRPDARVPLEQPRPLVGRELRDLAYAQLHGRGWGAAAKRRSGSAPVSVSVPVPVPWSAPESPRRARTVSRRLPAPANPKDGVAATARPSALARGGPRIARERVADHAAEHDGVVEPRRPARRPDAPDWSVPSPGGPSR
jgi:hypothetical protein